MNRCTVRDQVDNYKVCKEELNFNIGELHEAKKCPNGFEYGADFDFHDECNLSSCDSNTYEDCKRESQALNSLIAWSMRQKTKKRLLTDSQGLYR